MNAQQFFEAKLEFETDSADLFADLNNDEFSIVVVDARSREAYQREHIPGAINLPHSEMNAETTSSWDQSLGYVTYCDGIGCNASTKGALNLTRLGFNTKELLGGLAWWKRDGYPTERKSPTEGTGLNCNC